MECIECGSEMEVVDMYEDDKFCSTRYKCYTCGAEQWTDEPIQDDSSDPLWDTYKEWIVDKEL